ncbi:MAG: methyltransferase type 11 [Phenylobacterium zucineum]|nr:MAG: methyltransferase type 11 [Phenylobacterium zucineum]
MRRDVLELRQFYASDLGRAARAMVERKLREAWGDTHGQDVLALGYATPFVGRLQDRARRVVAGMPAQQGVEVWPNEAGNLAALTPEDSLPFQNALFDRVLVVHGLEESSDPVGYLREVWRVLSPSGKAIITVASRDGMWAGSESTPFGHGRPYSRSQLAELLREADLEPSGWTRALYVPPVGWMAGWAEGFEQAGSRLWPRFAGLLLMEAVKQTFAVKPQGQRARIRSVRPVLLPAPTPVSKAPAGAPLRQRLAPPRRRS